MEAILNVALPIFAVLACGYAAGKIGVMGEQSTAALNAFVWWFALPALLFSALARASLAEVYNLPFVIAFGGALLGTYALSMLAARLTRGVRLAEMSLHAIAGSFGNIGYMGIPLCITAFGPEGALPTTLAIIIGTTVMLALSVILIEIDLNAGQGLGKSLGGVTRAMVRNPVLHAIAAGVLISGLGVKLPAPINGFLDLLGKAAAPCALFATGLFLVGKSVGTHAGDVGMQTAFKMLLQPALTWLLASLLMDLDSVWAKAAILLAALPTATNAFILARQYNLFMDQASGIILVSTIASVPVVSVLIVLLGVG